MLNILINDCPEVPGAIAVNYYSEKFDEYVIDFHIGNYGFRKNASLQSVVKYLNTYFLTEFLCFETREEDITLCEKNKNFTAGCCCCYYSAKEMI